MQRFELEVTENATEVFRQLDLNKDYSWAYKTRQMEALYKTHMNEALEQRANVDPGYGAGVFDQSDSITADISFPQVSKMNETLNTLFFTKKNKIFRLVPRIILMNLQVLPKSFNRSGLHSFLHV